MYLETTLVGLSLKYNSKVRNMRLVYKSQNKRTKNDSKNVSYYQRQSKSLIKPQTWPPIFLLWPNQSCLFVFDNFTCQSKINGILEIVKIMHVMSCVSILGMPTSSILYYSLFFLLSLNLINLQFIFGFTLIIVDDQIVK